MDLDRTLIQIRERSYPEILDLGLVVVRRRPLALGLAALAGVAPFAALNAWLARDPEFNLAAYLLLLALEAPWATAPLTVVLGGMMFGARPTAWQAVKGLARGLPSLLVYQGFVRPLCVLTVVLVPLVPARLSFVNEVALLERGRLWKVASRSAALTGDRGAEMFGQWALQVLLGGLFVACVQVGTGAFVNALTTSELTWDRPGLATFYGPRVQAAVWLAVAFFGVVRFLTYIDQRSRLEGWEVKLRLQSVGRAMEEAGRW